MNEGLKESNYRNHLKHVTKDLFRHNYLTLLGLGQAVAFHLLAEKVYEILIDKHTLTINEMLETSTTLLILLLTWNEYYMGLSLFVWTATFFDTLIPFSLFITETIMVKSIDHTGTWFIGLCIFTFFCFWGLINELVQAKRYSENEIGLKKAQKRVKRAQIYLLLTSITSLTVLLLRPLQDNAQYTTVALVLFLLMFILYAIDTVIFWNEIIQFIRTNRKNNTTMNITNE